MKMPLVLNQSPRYLGCVFARTVGWGMDDNVMVRNETFSLYVLYGSVGFLLIHLSYLLGALVSKFYVVIRIIPTASRRRLPLVIIIKLSQVCKLKKDFRMVRIPMEMSMLICFR